MNLLKVSSKNEGERGRGQFDPWSGRFYNSIEYLGDKDAEDPKSEVYEQYLA